MSKNDFINTHRLLRSGRKLRALTQSTVAQHLGVNQSAYSRMEKGTQNIYVEQWLSFCDLTHIPFDSAQYGYIDFLTPIVITHDRNEGGFRIGKKFSNHRATSNRSTAPLLHSFSSSFGQDKLDEYLAYQKMDKDFFLLTGATLNVNFELDLLKVLIQKSRYSESTLKISEASGRLKSNPETEQTMLSSITQFVKNKDFYEKNFSWQILGQNGHSIELSVKPQDHMSEFNYRNDPVLQDHYCNYQKIILEKLASRGKSHTVSIVEKECLYKSNSAQQCLYQVC